MTRWRTRRIATATAHVVVLLLAACTDGPGPRASPPVTSSSPTPSNLGWQRCADGPLARQEVAAAVLDGKVYLAGGFTGGANKSPLVEAYDTATDTWESLPVLPISVDHAMAAAWDGKYVVIGGNATTGPSDQVFVLENGRWSTLPSLPEPRVAGAAVTVGEQIVVVGGTNADGHVRRTDIFDGTRWRAGPDIVDPRDHLGAATDGRLIYAVGGRRDGSHFDTFQLIDIQAGTATRLAKMPTARSGLGAAFVDGQVIAVGGEGPRIFPEVEAYDVASKTWRRLPDMGVPRHGVGVVASSSKVYALLGGKKVGLGASAACEVLDLA